MNWMKCLKTKNWTKFLLRFAQAAVKKMGVFQEELDKPMDIGQF